MMCFGHGGSMFKFGALQVGDIMDLTQWRCRATEVRTALWRMTCNELVTVPRLTSNEVLAQTDPTTVVRAICHATGLDKMARRSPEQAGEVHD
jgi:hypothetical protein